MADIVSEVIEHADGHGAAYLVERFESTVELGAVDFGVDNKIGCEACGKYNRNLSCPPYSPYFSDYKRDSGKAKIICYRTHLEHFAPAEERFRTAFSMVRGLLVKELLSYRSKGNLIAGAGACLSCEECVIEKGYRECRNPSEMIYSLESLGVNLISLSEKVFNLHLEWSGGGHDAPHVAAIGAVFFD